MERKKHNFSVLDPRMYRLGGLAYPCSALWRTRSHKPPLPCIGRCLLWIEALFWNSHRQQQPANRHALDLFIQNLYRLRLLWDSHYLPSGHVFDNSFESIKKKELCKRAIWVLACFSLLSAVVDERLTASISPSSNDFSPTLDHDDRPLNILGFFQNLLAREELEDLIRLNQWHGPMTRTNFTRLLKPFIKLQGATFEYCVLRCFPPGCPDAFRSNWMIKLSLNFSGSHDTIGRCGSTVTLLSYSCCIIISIFYVYV